MRPKEKGTMSILILTIFNFNGFKFKSVKLKFGHKMACKNKNGYIILKAPVARHSVCYFGHLLRLE